MKGRVIQANPVFGCLSEAQRTRLVACMRPVAFPGGAALIEQVCTYPYLYPYLYPCPCPCPCPCPYAYSYP